MAAHLDDLRIMRVCASNKAIPVLNFKNSKSISNGSRNICGIQHANVLSRIQVGSFDDIIPIEFCRDMWL
jgi:hypothetical protein